MIDGKFYIADSDRVIIGALPDRFYYDEDQGKDNDTYKLEISYSDYDPELYKNGNYVVCAGTETGGLLNNLTVDTKSRKVSFEGPTFRGLLDRRIICPQYKRDYYVIKNLYLSSAISRLFRQTVDTRSTRYGQDNHNFYEMEEQSYNKNLFNTYDATKIEGLGEGNDYLSSYYTSGKQVTFTGTTTSGTYFIDIGMHLETGYSYWLTYDSVTLNNIDSCTIAIVRSTDGTNFTAVTTLYNGSSSSKSFHFSVEPGYIYAVRVTYVANGSNHRITMVQPMLAFYETTTAPEWQYHQSYYSLGEPKITTYQVDRYASLMKTVKTLCEENGKVFRLRVIGYIASGGSNPHAGKEKFYIKAIFDDPKYTKNEIDLSEESGVNFTIRDSDPEYTHIIALGGGDLKDRIVKLYFIESTGAITEIASIPKTDAVKVYVYDYGSAGSEEELYNYTKKKAEEIVKKPAQNFIVENDMAFDVGDIATATDSLTGTTVEETITQKIIKVANGIMKTSYKIGDDI